MESEMSATVSTPLFNGPLETGVRSAIILYASYPRAYDLKHLTWLDHLVVHTGDLPEGLESLHPDIPQRSGELVVRRQLVEAGLLMMTRLHLVETHYTQEGILFSAREEASLFVQLMRSPYNCELVRRAQWLTDYIGRSNPDFLMNFISEKIGRWTIEFQEVSQ